MLTSLSAVAGLSAVGFGAFGAHALGDTFSVEQAGWWDTATLYLMVHAVGGLSLALASRETRLLRAGMLLVVGAGLFAATLFAMALGAPRWLGAITPVGGIGMIIAWGLILLHAIRSR